MPVNNLVQLSLIMQELLLCARCHVLHILLLIQGYLHGTAVGIHALQDLSVLHAGFEEGWIEREIDALLSPLMLNKRIDPLPLQVNQAATISQATCGLACITRHSCQHRLALVLEADFIFDKLCLTFYRL